MPNPQKIEPATVSRRNAVSISVSNFDSCDGRKFEVLPTVRPVGNGEVIVQRQLIRTDHSPVKIDYVMRQAPTGSIRRVALQRSDIEVLLAGRGELALVAGLPRKAVILSRRAV